MKTSYALVGAGIAAVVVLIMVLASTALEINAAPSPVRTSTASTSVPTQAPAPVTLPVPQPPAPTPAPPTSEIVTVTMTGTDATFTWGDASGNVHQTQGDGPVTFEIVHYPLSKHDTRITAMVIAPNGDAGCLVVMGDRVITDNTTAGQTAVTCTPTIP